MQAHRLYGALFFGAVKLIESMEDDLPSQALVLVEWMFVGALMAFGLLRLALGRD